MILESDFIHIVFNFNLTIFFHPFSFSYEQVTFVVHMFARILHTLEFPSRYERHIALVVTCLFHTSVLHGHNCSSCFQGFNRSLKKLDMVIGSDHCQFEGGESIKPVVWGWEGEHMVGLEVVHGILESIGMRGN